MASYADMAAKGPKQSDEEVRIFILLSTGRYPNSLAEVCIDRFANIPITASDHASPLNRVPPPVPEVMHEESGVHSLESLNSVNEHVQSLPSEASYADQQLAEERADEARREAKKYADEMSKEAKEFMHHAEADAQRLEKQAKHVKSKARKAAQQTEDWAEKNKGNPVVIGNAVVIAALGALLGTGAYRMHKANTLTWNVVGAWTGAVGLFAVGDYYVSQYFFKKYPPKN